MKTRIDCALMLSLVLAAVGATLTMAQQAPTGSGVPPHGLKAPATSTLLPVIPVSPHIARRARYMRPITAPSTRFCANRTARPWTLVWSSPAASPVPDAGGYADAAAQDRFCAGTYCWISIIYDQSPKHNDLTQAPRGGFAGPALGGFNNLPIADMAPITIMGHKVYGVFIEPGMGLRQNDVKGTAVDDQAEGAILGRQWQAFQLRLLLRLRQCRDRQPR